MSKQIVIIEDEPRAVNRIQRLIKEAHPDWEILGVFDSIASGTEGLQKLSSLDLIFADIQLSDGLSFEIFKKMDQLPPIIFTTAYDSYAIEAFKTNGIDYLLKPIQEVDLHQAIQKWNSLRSENLGVDSALLSILANKITRSNSLKKRFVVKIGDHLKTVKIEQIRMFYSFNKGSYLVTEQYKSYLIDSPLDIVEGQLDSNHFFRISRNTIIHIDLPEDILAWSNSRLKITLPFKHHEMVIVARNRTKDFKRWLEG